MRHVKDLEHVLRQIRLCEAVGEMLGDQRGLARMLHHHRIAGKDRRQHGVERRHVGKVPGRQVEDDAERLAADVALEAFLRPDIDVGEHLRRDRDHVARALLEAPHLARPVADRPAHLPGEQLRDARLVGDHRVDEGGRRSQRSATGTLAPVALRRSRPLERAADGLVVGERPLGIDRAVDGGDDFQGGSHPDVPVCGHRPSASPTSSSRRVPGRAARCQHLMLQYLSNPRFSSQSVIRRSYSNCSHSAVWT